VAIVNACIVEVANKRFQRVDHVVNLHAVNELSIVTHLCSDPVKLTVQLLEVRERSQMCRLDIISHLFIGTEVLNDHLPILDLLQLGGWLLKPLL
jgi:hypothetical protein